MDETVKWEGTKDRCLWLIRWVEKQAGKFFLAVFENGEGCAGTEMEIKNVPVFWRKHIKICLVRRELGTERWYEDQRALCR